MENIFFDGIGEVCATLPVEGEVSGGCVVKLNEQGAAVPCDEGDAFVGVANEKRSACTCVQFKGFVTVGYTGTLTPGWAALTADGKGGVKSASAGVNALVVKIVDDGRAVICL